MKSKAHIFLESAFYTLLTLPKLIILSKRYAAKRIKDYKNNANKIVILGNGPSLKATITEILSMKQNYETLCVNHFAESEYYKQIKPNFYVLNAPEMWMEDVESFHREKGQKLFKSIADNTSWSLQLFIPAQAKKVRGWQKVLSENKFITINYFNTTPLEGFEKFIFKMMENGWGMPRPHNVLIPSIILSMRMGFKKIYLAGADHSWLKEIFVSEDNEVFLTQKHFYDEKKAEARTMDKLGKGSRKLHEVLEKFTYAFSCYFLLNRYAKKKQISIINLTEGSFIDAFDRAKHIEA